MRESDALCRAIVADPDDDTPRLVYADWLQEHDRAEEAELIRVQCALEASPPDHPEYVEWQTREEELKLWLAAHAPGPEPKFPAGLYVSGGSRRWTDSRRGFPRFLEFDGNAYSGLKPMRDLAKAVGKAFAKLPTRWLVVRSVTLAQLAELLKQPVITGLDTLTLQLGITDDPQDEAARLLAGCPHLSNLRGLFAIFPVGDASAAALARSEHLTRLESLRLDSCAWLTAAGIRSLGSAVWFRGLRALDLNELSPAAFDELCALDPFPHLHSLELAGGSLPVAAWQAFARSKAFPRLTRLQNYTDMANGQVGALARAAWFRPAALDLTGCAVGNGGAAELAGTPWLASLRRLGLRANGIDPAGFAAIAGSRKLTGLEYLDLAYDSPGARGLKALAGNPALHGLKALILAGDDYSARGLTPSHVRDFLTRLDMPRLRHLDLSRRPLGGRAARVLAGDKFAALTRLGLLDCGLTDAAVAELVAAPALQNLVELNVGRNKLRDGLKPLADPAALPRLSWCVLSGNAAPRVGDALRKRGVSVV
jgi:uncharacterized protein (TIGR02996 family)